MATRRGIMGMRSILSHPAYVETYLSKIKISGARLHTGSTVTADGTLITRTSESGAWKTSFAERSIPVDRLSVFEIAVRGGLYYIPGFSVQEEIASFFNGNLPLNHAGIYATPGQAGKCNVNNVGIASLPYTSIPTVGEMVRNDVMGFGYDPFLGTVRLWRNGIPLNNGAPVFHSIVGKRLTPSFGLYGTSDALSLSTGEGLKYIYDGYCVMGEGRMLPAQSRYRFDSSRGLYIHAYDPAKLTAWIPIWQGNNKSSYSSGYINQTPLPQNRKSVIEFIYHNDRVCYGLIFDKTGTSNYRNYMLGTANVPSSCCISVSNYSAGSKNTYVYGQGCDINEPVINKMILPGDVVAIGYDPFNKTMVMWINGVPVANGLPIFSNINSDTVNFAYCLYQDGSQVRINPDVLRYDYGDYVFGY